MSKCIPRQLDLCGNNNCDICFNRSLISYKSKTKNNKFKINCFNVKLNNHMEIKYITKKDNKKYWFSCDVCHHDFEKRISCVTNGSWCPYCSLPCKKICNDLSCTFCINNLFISYNGKTKNGKFKKDCFNVDMNKKYNINKIFKCSEKKLWFNCDICKHNFLAHPNSINKGRWCPYCCIPCKKICNNINCKFCLSKTLASYQGRTKNNNLKINCWNKQKIKI